MKFRDASAIGLLVIAGCASTANTGSSGAWLLMVPPLTSGGDADTGAPLSKWQNIGNFGYQTDCNSSMATQQMGVQAHYGPITTAQTPGQAEHFEVAITHHYSSAG